MNRNTRARFAGLASGALIAGGLVVAPSVAGLAAASAAPVAIDYTCAATTPLGPLSLPGTVTLDVTTPASVAPGADFPAGISAKLDFGKADLPISELSGSFDIPLTVGDETATFTTPTAKAPTSALVYTADGTLDMTAPAAAGDAPITVGTIIGNFSALGIPIAATCLPDAGENLTVGQLKVSDGGTDPDPDPVAVPVTGSVAISGTPKVGKSLSAKPGSTDGATVSYQWLANGKAIAKATKPTLKLTKAVQGKKVSVRATYAQDGYLDVVQTSKAVKVKPKKK